MKQHLHQNQNNNQTVFGLNLATFTDILAADTHRWFDTAVTDTILTRNDLQAPKSARTTRSNRFEGGQKSPPGTLSTLTYDVSSTQTTLTDVNTARIRIRGSAENITAVNIIRHVDGARWLVDDTATVPTPSLGPSPTPSSTSVPGNPSLGKKNINHDIYASCHSFCMGKSAQRNNRVAGGDGYCHPPHDGRGVLLAHIISPNVEN